ncbi:DUF3363 domain-containing protein [Candidatus Igneacidithiobacillus taiwanensis]|uniref:DUF3363 domain-containing protein n=1 Tax=Candidatus Igneacidithiobacillus taiwanensis TaxID=1945924 RepID=UPI0028963448|nr:DUF3363 domain-containing protein [Candidatus Igneacidithiobacillus taiwanensis]
MHRARSSHGGARSLQSVQATIKRLLPPVGSNYYHAPTSKGPPLRQAGRRCLVKVVYVRNKKPGQWQAHGHYLSREGAQQEQDKGVGFDAKADAVPLARLTNDWQEANDPHLFKVTLSPEDPLPAEALRDLTRKFNARIQHQMGREYEWVAIDHHNTSHPHVHLLIRGKGKLELAPDMIRRGMREAAQEILTESLGYRTEREIQAAREREIDQRRFTGIDREILEKVTPAPQGYGLVEETPPPLLKDREREGRRIRLARLENLTLMGVADKIGPNLWRLEPGWDKALKEMQVLQSRTRMVAEARALMTEPRCLPQVTRIKPGDRLVGRMLGTGLDEQYERSYLLIEGVDNRIHIVYQTTSMEKARGEEKLSPRMLVALTGLERGVAVKDYGVEIPDQGWKKIPVPTEALDDQLAHESRHPPKDRETPTTGFAAEWHRRLLERRKEKERERLEKEKTKAAQQAKKEQEAAGVKKRAKKQRGTEIE